MTVSRRVEVSFDAPDDETADWFADFLRRVVMGEEWPAWGDIGRLPPDGVITGQAWSAERVAMVHLPVRR